MNDAEAVLTKMERCHAEAQVSINGLQKQVDSLHTLVLILSALVVLQLIAKGVIFTMIVKLFREAVAIFRAASLHTAIAEKVHTETAVAAQDLQTAANTLHSEAVQVGEVKDTVKGIDQKVTILKEIAEGNSGMGFAGPDNGRRDRRTGDSKTGDEK